MSFKTAWIKGIRAVVAAALFGCMATDVKAGDRHALLIAWNDYSAESGLLPLRFAAKDVSDLRDTLVEMGYDAADISVLNGSDQGSVPTAKKIREALDDLQAATATSPGSSVMIVFAGHGFNHEGESYLCPADYRQDKPTRTAISVAEVSQVLERSRADGRYLIIDACRNEFLSAGSAEFNLRTGMSKLQISQRTGAQGAVVLSSCVPGQQSWEVDEPKMDRKGSPQPRENGVFMHYIMQGLRGAADVYDQQSGFDGIITASELHEYAARETYRFVNAEHDTSQTPWADVHATASLGIVTLNEEQRRRVGRIEHRSPQSVLDQQLAEQKTGDGVMLLVGGDRELRPLASARFSQAIDLSPDLYMPRRLRALMSVLEGNNNRTLSPELYRRALEDMKAVGSPLRVAIPYNAVDLPVFGPSSTGRGTKTYKTVATVSGGDVLEVDDVQDASETTWLKVRRINRWLVDESTGQIQESLLGYIQLAAVAKPEADKAQLQDVNRLRKPTTEELRLMNRSRPVAMGNGNAGNAADALGVAASINDLAGGPSGVSTGIGIAQGAIQLADEIRADRQNGGRVKPTTIINGARRFGAPIPSFGW